MSDIVELDHQAVNASIEIVQRVTGTDLARPTPCEGWTLTDLLAHMTVQHRGFASAARGNVDDRSVWVADADSDDPVADYLDAADDVLDAFASIDVGQQKLWLPEVRDGGPFAAETAVAFHLVDYVVHAWDVAVTIGAVPTFSDELLDTALVIAQLVPDDAEREQPGAAFAHALPTNPKHSTLDQILLLLGRQPLSVLRNRDRTHI